MRLGLRGWVMNTSEGTVVGEAYGTSSAINEMSTWLSEVGSPKSKIRKAEIEETGKGASDFAEAFAVRK